MNDCHITEDMLNAIPDEWKKRVEDLPDKYQGPSEEEIKAIDGMLILYYGKKSKASLAKLMKQSTHFLDKRIKILQEEGKL